MWQPIETAPKDRFLLLCGPSGYTTTPLVFVTGCMHSDYHAGRWVDHANDDLSDWGFAPTHWMPLPDLPGAANTSLIAAAPEMLLVLQTIARKTLHRGTTMLHEEEMILVAQAIARATGGQP